MGTSASVPRMAQPQAHGLAYRAAERQAMRARVRRARRTAALAVVACVCLVVLLLTAFGSGKTAEVTNTGPAPAQRLLPAGPPRAQIVALQDTLRIQLPINQSRVTAIGYHSSGTSALALDPIGTQANAGLLKRFVNRFFGDSAPGSATTRSAAESGPETGGLDVGAPTGTDVYAPVDGSVMAVSDQIVNGKPYGVRIDIQPSGQPGGRRHAHQPRGRPSADRRHRPSRPGGRRSGASSTSPPWSRPRSPATRRTAASTCTSRCTRPARSPCPRDRSPALVILFIADVFGPPGRRALEARLPALRDELGAGFCVVNGENAADGVGLTAKLADKILAAGADVITLGQPRLAPAGHHPGARARAAACIRPATSAGRAGGLTVQPAADGTPVAVINLQGALFLSPPTSPFLVVDDLVEEARREAKIVLVDFHAEATSEKVALARMLDGRVTAVIGTHTHVQTNDARVQPGGTAAITDAGMTGPHDSVIGVRAELAIERMRTAMPVRFHPAEGDVRIEGAVVECDAEGRATRCEPLRVLVD